MEMKEKKILASFNVLSCLYLLTENITSLLGICLLDFLKKSHETSYICSFNYKL